MFGWPVVCIAFFARMPTEKAAVWSLLGGYMLLPSDWQVDAPLLPPMDKMAIAGIATIILCCSKGTSNPRPRVSVLTLLFGLGFLIAPILTSFDNSYELQGAGKSIHGFYPSDGIKFAGRNLMSLIPMFIGWRYLSTDSARAFLLKALPSATLIYSLPMLYEIRMSPQLHRLVYGYFPSSFVQQMREGGFRPVVFFNHGLSLAMFVALAILAAVVIVRARMRLFQFKPGPIAAYLSGLLLLCKSLGPVIYVAVFAPVILFTRPRFWVKIGCVLSLFVCAYPYLRGHGLAPTELVSGIGQSVSAEREASFQTRVVNEEQLLAKAYQKPLFGWGGWSRNRIFDDWGKDVSITDGGWIIQYGMFGWFGYLSLFGLFFIALVQAHRAMDSEVSSANLTRAGLAVLLTIYVVDCIPNGMLTSLIFLLTGCVASTQRLPRSLRVTRAHAPRKASSGELAVAN
jgi:hypothetical protein